MARKRMGQMLRRMVVVQIIGTRRSSRIRLMRRSFKK
jgi:hypothetical protein